MKLWDKGSNTESSILDYTVGDDYILDRALLKWDIAGSIAHVMGLQKACVLSPAEANKLIVGLKSILKEKTFKIKKEEEDVHTAVESQLTKLYPNIGGKVHTGRSRNDQVLLDVRLYSKDKLHMAICSIIGLAEVLLLKAEKHKDTVMPGYTHTQKAMPSTFGLFAASHMESLLDDILLLKGAYELNDQSPLGSAAGYGVSIKLDRKYTAELLGFTKVQNNTLYCSSSRGKIESAILNALSSCMISMGKLASDLIWFSSSEFGFVSLPDELTTGSSIMPQKKNPDVLEIVRGKASTVQSLAFEVQNIMKSQFSGYNRDYQLTKGPLMKGFEITLSTASIMNLAIKSLVVHEKKMKESLTPEIFAADKAISLAASGIPFRDAYKKVAQIAQSDVKPDHDSGIFAKKNIGSAGNLCLSISKKKIEYEKKEISLKIAAFEKKMLDLVGRP